MPMKLRVYIVEDCPIMAAALKKMVTLIGHSVVGVAASYEDAVSDLLRIDVDMVITDIMLIGQKTGIDVAVYVNENLHIPIVYQSSITDSQVIMQALSTEPLAFLSKPVSRTELINALLSVEPA